MYINTILMYILIWIFKVFFYIYMIININFSNNSKLNIKTTKNRFILILKNVQYKNLFKIDNMTLKLFPHTTPFLKINYASIKLAKFVAAPSPNFKLWDNHFMDTESIINYITKYVNIYKSGTIFTKKIKINVDEFVFRLFGVFIKNENTILTIKISKIKIFYKNMYVGFVNRVIINNLHENQIYIDTIILNISENLLRENILEKIIKIVNTMPKNIDSKLPEIIIHKVKINIIINNYIALNFQNITFKDTLSIHNILIKMYKKDIIWANDIVYDYNKSYPVIQNVRLRLFSSTSDKIYKSLIYFRKRYYHFQKNKITSNEFNGEVEVMDNYLHNLRNSLKDENIYTSDIIVENNSNHLIQPNIYDINGSYIRNIVENICNFKLIIETFKIDIQKNKGTLLFKNFIFKQNSKYNQILISKWVFSKHSHIYIDKISDDGCFIINFNDKNFDIFPYKTFVNLNIKVFSEMTAVLIKNINRFRDIFINNNARNKGYLFESFTIDSFYSNFNYTKNKFKLSRFIDGEISQILNLTGAQDINLLIDDLRISYPKNWDIIVTKILEKYVTCVKKYNLDSIIKKTSGKSIVAIKNLQSNMRSFSEKIYNTLHKNSVNSTDNTLK